VQEAELTSSATAREILRDARLTRRYTMLLGVPGSALDGVPADGGAAQTGSIDTGTLGDDVDLGDGVATALAEVLAAGPAPEPPAGAPAGQRLRAAPAEALRPATGEPGPDQVADYLAHSCDLVLNGGLATSLAAPLAVCALAEHYLLRRVGGSSAAAASAAAAAAAELGRTAAGEPRPTTGSGPDPAERPGTTVRPGFAGLADAIAWLAGADTDSDENSSSDHDSWRLARMFRPADDAVELHRLATAAVRPQGGKFRGRSLRVFAAVLAGLDGVTWAVIGLLWLGAIAGCTGVLTALAQSAEVSDVLVPFAAVPLAVTFVLAAGCATVLLAGNAVRGAVRDALGTDGWGLVAGVDPGSDGAQPSEPPSRLERFAGVLGPAGVPPLFTWITDRLDDLAGVPPADPGAERYALTFGDLWLGRLGRRSPAEVSALRSAALHPDQRVVDLILLTTDVSRGRPYLLPFGTATRPEELRTRGYLFCRTCLVEVLPARVADEMVLLSPGDPAGEPDCPRHLGQRLRQLPDPWDLPVAFAVRLAVAAPGLLRAVPLYRADGDRADGDRADGDPAHRDPAHRDPAPARTHWFCDGALAGGLPTQVFDVALPLWPTFSIGTHPSAGDGPVFVPEHDAHDHPQPWRPVPGAAGLAGAAADAVRSWRDVLRAQAPGVRGRSALVRRGDLGPFLSAEAVRELAVRGHRAGTALRERFTGPDGAGQELTGTDRHRWTRMRAVLTEFRRLSLSIDAGVPLYTDLALRYRVPDALTPWFGEHVEAGSADPAWGDVVTAITHLRSLARGGVLDWDTDWGTPPSDPHLRLG
jgi:hypothetical protein